MDIAKEAYVDPRISGKEKASGSPEAGGATKPHNAGTYVVCNRTSKYAHMRLSVTGFPPGEDGLNLRDGYSVHHPLVAVSHDVCGKYLHRLSHNSHNIWKRYKSIYVCRGHVNCDRFGISYNSDLQKPI